MKSKGGGFGGMQQLMRQANQMQSKMKKTQEELAQRQFSGRAGGGAIEVQVNGEYLIQSVSLNPEVVRSGDAEMLQDLFLAATNEAIKLARKTTEEEMGKITGGVGMPGLF